MVICFGLSVVPNWIEMLSVFYKYIHTNPVMLISDNITSQEKIKVIGQSASNSGENRWGRKVCVLQQQNVLVIPEVPQTSKYFLIAYFLFQDKAKGHKYFKITPEKLP